jgi:DNA-binding CsgD family transcriptional regulator
VKGQHTNTLSDRELQVLEGMANGKSNAEIGRELHVSEDTVKTHARPLFRKLGARDRAHAVAIGYQQGLLVGARAASRPDDTVRLGAAHAWLDEWQPVRREAPDHSRFARLYDGLAERLAARPPS